MLALHEGALVGMASGYAIGSGEPAFVLVHTTAGLGNAVSALATARVNRAPLVVLVGQQDRRHLAQEPFLAGRLHGLAGDYPVWVDQPVRAQDVPGALTRAWHEARTARGPALVIVPMDDWLAPAGEPHEIAAPARLLHARAAEPAAIAELADLLEQARSPVLVVGAGADDPDAWAALVELAERLACPVWQEAFGARAGFPQDHPRFAGHLPAGRGRLREALAGARPGAGRRRAGVPAVPLRARPAGGAGHARGGRDRRPGRGAPQPGRPRGARGPAASVRRARRACCRSPRARRPSRWSARPRPRRRRTASRCAPRTCWRRSASACRPTRCWWRRRPRRARS